MGYLYDSNKYCIVYVFHLHFIIALKLAFALEVATVQVWTEPNRTEPNRINGLGFKKLGIKIESPLITILV